jgi:ubiquinone/menaquinone biosynthesis C-methylase UbiE
MKNIHHHFSRVAHKYRDLRTTDLEPINYITEKLPKKKRLMAADFGCGAGRYDMKLLHHLGPKTFLTCLDANKDMLKHLKEYLREHGRSNFAAANANAARMPLKAGSMDCIFSFNAVHHFNLPSFLRHAALALKGNGWLFIYTRLKSQNRRNIWGRHFPLFNVKENRLYGLSELRKSVKDVPGLIISSIEYFKYHRQSSLHCLVNQALNHHYSTFYLYAKNEFAKAIVGFERSVGKKYKDMKNIRWYDENALLVARKRPG